MGDSGGIGDADIGQDRIAGEGKNAVSVGGAAACAGSCGDDIGCLDMVRAGY